MKGVIQQLRKQEEAGGYVRGFPKVHACPPRVEEFRIVP